MPSLLNGNREAAPVTRCGFFMSFLRHAPCPDDADHQQRPQEKRHQWLMTHDGGLVKRPSASRHRPVASSYRYPSRSSFLTGVTEGRDSSESAIATAPMTRQRDRPQGDALVADP